LRNLKTFTSMMALVSFSAMSNDANVSIPVSVTFDSYCTIIDSPDGLSFKGSSGSKLSNDFDITWQCFGTEGESLKLFFSPVTMPDGREVVITQPNGQVVTEATPLVVEFDNGKEYTSRFVAQIDADANAKATTFTNWQGMLNGVFELQ